MSDNRTVFAERFRIPSTRMSKWDYAGNGSYFITICTYEKYPWFGHIRNGIMCLSDIGSIVEQYWSGISDHFPHAYIDTHIVMPDHIHGIITINGRSNNVHDNTDVMVVETSESDVSTGNDHHIGIHPPIKRHTPGSLGSIMNQYKSMCTKRIRTMGINDFAWQPRFHDHVIRHSDAYDRIRQYIIQNPSKWQNKNIVAE